MMNKEVLGKQIVAYRKHLGVTQKDLAESLHVTCQAVSRWELGSSMPTVEMLYNLAEIFQISIDVLLKGEEFQKNNITYMDSGLNVAKLYKVKDRLQMLVTEDERLLRSHYKEPVFYHVNSEEWKNPVHVVKTYVPGSKLRMAREYGYDREICQDLVAVSVNHMLQYGVKPLIFHTNILCGNSDGEQLMQMGRALQEGCKDADVSFAGMEVSCQPVNFLPTEYELMASLTGIAEQSELYLPDKILQEKIREGDVVIGLLSEGINGTSYPYVKIMLERTPKLAYQKVDEKNTFIDALNKPTTNFVKPVMELKKAGVLHGAVSMASSILQINGYKNILPEHLGVCIDLAQIPVLPLYRFMERKNMLDREYIPHRFHMGIAMIVIVPQEQQERALDLIRCTRKATVIGQIKRRQDSDIALWTKDKILW